jgi:hypothetical protein
MVSGSLLPGLPCPIACHQPIALPAAHLPSPSANPSHLLVFSPQNSLYELPDGRDLIGVVHRHTWMGGYLVA